jgi:HlyD family secretion protein
VRKQDIGCKKAANRVALSDGNDEVLYIASSREFYAWAAGAVLCIALVFWFFKGTIAWRTTGQGVIVRSGGILTLVTSTGGLLTAVNVRPGQLVEPNQVVARIAQPLMQQEIKERRLERDLAKVSRDLAFKTDVQQANLQSVVIGIHYRNALQELAVLGDQRKHIADRIPVLERLFAKSLIPEQQIVATRQKLAALDQRIASTRALLKQYEAQEFQEAASPAESDIQRTAQLRHAELMLAAIQKQAELSQAIVSPRSGEVLEVKVATSTVVAPDTALVTIQPTEDNLEALAFVPSEAAKNVEPGMAAEVSPSMVKREEFGFIRGKVTWVGEYPSSSAALMREFENESLVRSLIAAGPVTEVRVKLARDQQATSGFQWSSSKGPPLKISGGTISQIAIVIRERTPAEIFTSYIAGVSSPN